MAKEDPRQNYDDIIMLPHPVSSVHPAMPVAERAAQFMPFAALTGYGDAISETGRLTEERIELDEDECTIIDQRLRMLQEKAAQRPEVSVTYFRPDVRKAGGAYVTVTGRLKKIDTYQRSLTMEDGTRIPLEEIAGLDEIAGSEEIAGSGMYLADENFSPIGGWSGETEL